jgi:hypothetical protein
MHDARSQQISPAHKTRLVIAAVQHGQGSPSVWDLSFWDDGKLDCGLLCYNTVQSRKWCPTFQEDLIHVRNRQHILTKCNYQTAQQNTTCSLKNVRQSRQFLSQVGHLNITQGMCCTRLLPAQNAGTATSVHTIRQNRHVTAAGTWPYRQECAERVRHNYCSALLRYLAQSLCGRDKSCYDNIVKCSNWL